MVFMGTGSQAALRHYRGTRIAYQAFLPALDIAESPCQKFCMPLPTLYILCGKIASGKSTLAARLAEDADALVISEDKWLFELFGDQMATGADYVRFASKLRSCIEPHVIALLNMGVSVVMDFQANTVESRLWMRTILDQSGAEHKLYVLNTPDEVCLARLRERNAAGQHPFHVTEEQFLRFTQHFHPPTPDEGFDVVTVDAPQKSHGDQ